MEIIYRIKGKEGFWTIIEKSGTKFTMRIHDGTCCCTCDKNDAEEVENSI